MEPTKICLKNAGVEIRHPPGVFAGSLRPLRHLLFALIGIRCQMADIGDVDNVSYLMAIELQDPLIAQIFIRVTGTVSIADDGDTHAQPSFTICVQRTGSGTFVLMI